MQITNQLTPLSRCVYQTTVFVASLSCYHAKRLIILGKTNLNSCLKYPGFNTIDCYNLNCVMYFTDIIDFPISCDRHKGEDQINEFRRKEFTTWWNDRFHHYSKCLRSLKIDCLK